MNYDKMLDKHIENNADCTIATITVPWEEASRFGILSADEDGRITEFAEKPRVPKSNQASMGIYLFKKDKLREYLIKDELTEGSSNDFGKNIIPNMLNDGCRMVAYPFKGYWKDVGTIDSLWQANMDLIDDDQLDLLNNKSNWKIYTEDTFSPPQYISSKASVSNSLINQGCYIEGEVKHSVLFNDVKVGKNAKVIDSVILPGSVIEDGAVIKKCIVDNKMIIKANEKINKDGKNVLLVSGGVK
jgi:glucose-1-phosphate adenylyltransferase